MPSGNTTSRHRADAPVATTLPRPIRRAIGAGGLAVVLAGSLAFAATQPGSSAEQNDLTGTGVGSAANSLTGRTGVWDQASRSGEVTRDVLDEAGEPVTFTVTVDGRDVEITSNAGTLADALIDNGIVVGIEDNVSVPMNGVPTEGMDVQIERVGTQHGTETEAIPFETIERETSSLERGETRTETEGVDGTRVIAYTAVYEGGDEVSRTTQAEILVSEPVDEVILIGTADPASEPAPATSGSSGSSNSSSSSDDSAPSGSYSGSDPRGIARSMVEARGWGGDQWSCLDSLWQRESNWNPYAQNPSSGAYGIPQSLPGTKMASAGSDWRTNPATQITWGLNYIEGRYGTPCGAWSHSESVGWY
ncbi:G5 domain-containing protein [Ruania halotolerans]|uniref:aggregation-promoting factor C-terminal-like domain-containing protein n=1 Tax=Ruania halotolerans TaxID=2897773 RepID=UPI001E5EF2D4|nr:G5 domain-containing protein [Ruania halotolerans]UFU07396.1 G5 domain-containing protein [Ruania halotolerans]